MLALKKAAAYYKSLSPSALCGCNYCKNYCVGVRAAYPELAAYLAAFGADIEKPFETSPLEPDVAGFIEYCACQYIIFGTCGADYKAYIGDVELRTAASYPDTGIGAKHFALECAPIKLRFIF